MLATMLIDEETYNSAENGSNDMIEELDGAL